MFRPPAPVMAPASARVEPAVDPCGVPPMASVVRVVPLAREMPLTPPRVVVTASLKSSILALAVTEIALSAV